MNKILWTALLAGVVLLLANPVSAQVPWTISAKTYTSSTANDLTDVTVYGITLLATSADASAGIYDSSTAPGYSMTTNRGELGEASISDFASQLFEVPQLISNLSVRVHNGALTVYYR